MNQIGKIDLNTFEQFLLHRLGKPDPHVLVPPLTGVDSAVLKLDTGSVMIVAEDPIFPMPGKDYKDFGWYIVHIGASDVAVMGVKPQYITYTLLMPINTSQEELRQIIDSIHNTALDLEMTILGGHTGYYPAVTVPTVGGITVFSFAKEGEYITPKGAQIGDAVIVTKGPAIETVGLLASLYEEELKEKFSLDFVQRCQGYMKKMSVVKDALSAKAAGGVHAMHDATEGGVLGGLYEVANASGVGMRIDESRFIWTEEIEGICRYFGIDPLQSIAEGTLILTAETSSAPNILAALKREGIEASVVGEVVPHKEGQEIKRRDGTVEKLKIPEQDPFWPIFFKDLEKQ
ncbi:MAG: AIR synthase family protein [Spirochaetales bacterium]|nr:AIR synthase family protein [Spirochaetales bacterium]